MLPSKYFLIFILKSKLAIVIGYYIPASNVYAPVDGIDDLVDYIL